MRSAKEYKAIREEIYRFIGAYITKHVYAPSNKEIAEAVGISGTTVHRHLIDMIDEGFWRPMQNREHREQSGSETHR